MTMLTSAMTLSAADVRDVLTAAAAAPSLHNTQPWRFGVHGDRIELYADRSRWLPATDPDGREALLSCGAALFNLRLALLAHGVRPWVAMLPHGWDARWSTPLATVTVNGRGVLGAELESLARAIPRRRTNRKPFVDAPVPSGHIAALRRAADAEGALLSVMTEPGDIARLRSLIAAAQAAQQSDPAFQAELAEWTGRPTGPPEGVPLTASGPTPEPQDEWVLRDFTGGSARVRLPGKDFEGRPLLAVLSGHYDGPAAQAAAGQALERVLLTATSLGLAVSLLSQPVEVPAGREGLRALVGPGVVPQAVLRFGFGSPTPATPRRDVADILV